jgi:hypothetical protein
VHAVLLPAQDRTLVVRSGAPESAMEADSESHPRAAIGETCMTKIEEIKKKFEGPYHLADKDIKWLIARLEELEKRRYSTCACKFDESESEIISACAAHEVWKAAQR